MASHVTLQRSMISDTRLCQFMAPILHYYGILYKILSLYEFHSETNLGGRSGASITILSKAGMHCIWHQAENKKNEAKGQRF